MIDISRKHCLQRIKVAVRCALPKHVLEQYRVRRLLTGEPQTGQAGRGFFGFHLLMIAL